MHIPIYKTIQGWCNLLITCTYSMKWAMCLLRTPRFFRYRFTATSWPYSLPRNTWPYPPLPIGFSIFSDYRWTRKVNFIPLLSKYSDTFAELNIAYIECSSCLGFCSWAYWILALILFPLICHSEYLFFIVLLAYHFPFRQNCSMMKNLMLNIIIFTFISVVLFGLFCFWKIFDQIYS